jgi:hypothetical protein
MDAKTFLQGQIVTQRRVADAVLGGLTQEQMDWTPPGTANRIGTILLHLNGTDDAFINARALGRPRLWESGSWAERIGLPEPPGRAGYWDEANRTSLPLGPVLEYQAAVRAALDASMAELSDEELARLVPSPFGEQPIAGILGLLVVHAAGHFGEIAALKGAQGAKGLPF